MTLEGTGVIRFGQYGSIWCLCQEQQGNLIHVLAFHVSIITFMENVS